jgi:hypothetical protein
VPQKVLGAENVKVQKRHGAENVKPGAGNVSGAGAMRHR